MATFHNYMFDYWADPVVHILLIPKELHCLTLKCLCRNVRFCGRPEQRRHEAQVSVQHHLGIYLLLAPTTCPKIEIRKLAAARDRHEPFVSRRPVERNKVKNFTIGDDHCFFYSIENTLDGNEEGTAFRAIKATRNPFHKTGWICKLRICKSGQIFAVNLSIKCGCKLWPNNSNLFVAEQLFYLDFSSHDQGNGVVHMGPLLEIILQFRTAILQLQNSCYDNQQSF